MKNLYDKSVKEIDSYLNEQNYLLDQQLEKIKIEEKTIIESQKQIEYEKENLHLKI